MKQIKSNIISFIAGAIIFSSITAYAASTILSKDITYTPSNQDWDVTNVEDAINDLYSNIKTSDELTLNYQPGTNNGAFSNFDMRIYLTSYKDQYQYFMITQAEPVSTIASKCENIFFNSTSDQTTGNLFLNTEYLLNDYNRISTGISGNKGCFYDITIKLYN